MLTSNRVVSFTGIVLVMLATTVACGKKKDDKGGSTPPAPTNSQNSGNQSGNTAKTPSGSDTIAPSTTTTTTISESTNVIIDSSFISLNSSVAHSHLLVVANVNDASLAITKVTIDGIEVKSGGDVNAAGDGSTYKSGTISSSSVNELVLSARSTDKEKTLEDELKADIVKSVPSAPFFYVRNFSKGIGSTGKERSVEVSVKDAAGKITVLKTTY